MYTAKLNSFNNQSQQARSAISFNGWFSKPKSPSEKLADMLGVPTSTGEEIIKTAQNVNDFVDKGCTATQEMLKNCSDKEKYEMNFIANSFQKIKKIFSSISLKNKPVSDEFTRDVCDFYESGIKFAEENPEFKKFATQEDRNLFNGFKEVINSIKTKDKEQMKNTACSFFDNSIKYFKEAPKESFPEKEVIIDLLENCKKILSSANGKIDKNTLRKTFSCFAKLIKLAISDESIRNLIKMINNVKV